jgi:phosphomannomutase
MLETVRGHVSETAARNIEEWLTLPKFEEYKQELESLIADERWKDLEDAFFKVIEFGTGGRRGIVGLGSNRINRVTIGESTQALCEYAKSVDPEAPSKGIVIACDTRLSSEELSRYVATVTAANEFTTYIFESFRSTPELSFAVRHLGCAAGVVITASHNAPEYNGFKAYWSDGAQLVPPHDSGVLAVAESIERIDALDDYAQAVAEGRIKEIGTDVDEAYIDAVLNERMGAEPKLKIAYSPLHGAGQRNTLPALEKAGFEVLTVKEQMVPDGHFPTMEDGRANPEKQPANDRVVALMLAENADIAVSNDPDADRLGIMVNHNSDVVYLSGNQTAALVTEYVLSKLHQQDTLSDKHYIAKTIVTTDLLNAIAEKYTTRTISNLHVGFKWICEVINQQEKNGGIFVTGSEESFGLMKGSYTRDKDGAVALLAAEYAAELKAKGKTLYDALLDLFAEHGLYVECLTTATCEGAQGFTDMQNIMKSLRERPLETVEGHDITAVLDYASLERKDIQTGEVRAIDMIASNVLVYEFGDSRRRVTIRPSGTEPIIKFYVQWHDDTDTSEAGYNRLLPMIDGMARALEGLSLERA